MNAPAGSLSRGPRWGCAGGPLTTEARLSIGMCTLAYRRTEPLLLGGP